MIERYRDGVVPEAERRPGAGRRASTACPSGLRELLDRAELTQALEEIWALVRRLNRYVEETRDPWDLAEETEPRLRPSGSTRCSTAWPRACG